MKKVILLSALLIGAIGTSNAQNAKFGLKGGLNVSSFYTNENVSFDAKAGIHIGALVEIKVSDKFFIQPELTYSNQGAKYSQSGINSQGYSYNSVTSYNFNYINLPVMVKFYPSKKFSVEFGPQVGFLLNAKAKPDVTFTTPGIVSVTPTEIDIKSFFKSNDFALNFGLGYDFTKNVFAQARYNVGVSNIDNTGTNGETTLNRVFQLSLGYKF